MPWSTESERPGDLSNNGRYRAGLKRWNCKLHVFSGLFLLFFMWLFAISGLVSAIRQSFTEFWKNRKQTNYERDIAVPGPDAQGYPA